VTVSAQGCSCDYPARWADVPDHVTARTGRFATIANVCEFVDRKGKAYQRGCTQTLRIRVLYDTVLGLHSIVTLATPMTMLTSRLSAAEKALDAVAGATS